MQRETLLPPDRPLSTQATLETIEQKNLLDPSCRIALTKELSSQIIDHPDIRNKLQALFKQAKAQFAQENTSSQESSTQRLREIFAQNYSNFIAEIMLTNPQSPFYLGVFADKPQMKHGFFLTLAQKNMAPDMLANDEVIAGVNLAKAAKKLFNPVKLAVFQRLLLEHYGEPKLDHPLYQTVKTHAQNHSLEFEYQELDSLLAGLSLETSAQIESKPEMEPEFTVESNPELGQDDQTTSNSESEPNINLLRKHPVIAEQFKYDIDDDEQIVAETQAIVRQLIEEGAFDEVKFSSPGDWFRLARDLVLFNKNSSFRLVPIFADGANHPEEFLQQYWQILTNPEASLEAEDQQEVSPEYQAAWEIAKNAWCYIGAVLDQLILQLEFEVESAAELYQPKVPAKLYEKFDKYSHKNQEFRATMMAAPILLLQAWVKLRRLFPYQKKQHQARFREINSYLEQRFARQYLALFDKYDLNGLAGPVKGPAKDPGGT